LPYKPKSPCSYRGCSKLADKGSYCAEHTKKESQYYNKYRRDPKTRKRYGTEWRKIRARFIKLNPLCEECKKQNRVTPVEEVHHIIPLSKGGTHVENNLMSLCKSCHSKITRKEK
jgi:5-methylcytosine-specific restriction enzyme A